MATQKVKETKKAELHRDHDTVVADLKSKKETAFDFRKRKHEHWDENYLMYRDKISTNRITQRQAVNLPLIKETLRTDISKTDEEPNLYFENLDKGNDAKRQEIVMNEMWRDHYDDQHLDIIDNVEKKIHGLYGRGFKHLVWDWDANKVCTYLRDPYDVLIDPKVNPLNLQSANYVMIGNIFKPLRTILANDKYTQEGKDKLKIYLDTKSGIIKAAQDDEERRVREQRLSALGVTNFDEFGASDVTVELTQVYDYVWHDSDKRFVRHLVILADDNAVLLDKPLKEAIGIEKIPLITWADDPDINDIWSDSKADTVRTINKVINIFISQLLENRTYRNLGMFFFDSTNQKFRPGSFTPRPFGMYPVPGNPKEIMQQVEIQQITDTINEINFLISLVEKATATTSLDKGVEGKAQNTLGEVQLALGESKKVTAQTSKFYRAAWKEYGEIWYEYNQANLSGKVKLQKKSTDGEYYTKEFDKGQWKSKAGYNVRIEMKSQKDSKDTEDLQKLTYVKNEFKDNVEAVKIIKRKTLELLGWTPEDIQAVMSAEEQKGIQNNAMLPGGKVPPGGGAPTDPNAPQAGAVPIDMKALQSLGIK